MNVLLWTIDFSQIIAAVYWLSAAVAVLSLLLVFQVMWMRRAARSREKRTKVFRTVWSVILGPPGLHAALLPAVPPSEIPVFLTMWNLAQAATYDLEDEETAADARDYLNDIARRLRMDSVALNLLRKRDVATRLAAIEMLGYLNDVTATPTLRSLADSQNSVLSFAAARSLLQVNQNFAERFVELMSRRPDWSPAKLQAVIQDERAALASPIMDAVRTSAPAVSRNLVQYLRFFAPNRSLPVVRHLLETVADPATLTAALKVLGIVGSEQDAALAANLAGHEDWRVRVQVANTLGKLGDRQQIPVVTALLDDAYWWVRYRAAQAIAILSKDDEARLRDILLGTRDRYARDILTQIIAEAQPVFQGGSAS